MIKSLQKCITEKWMGVPCFYWDLWLCTVSTVSPIEVWDCQLKNSVWKTVFVFPAFVIILMISSSLYKEQNIWQRDGLFCKDLLDTPLMPVCRSDRPWGLLTFWPSDLLTFWPWTFCSQLCNMHWQYTPLMPVCRSDRLWDELCQYWTFRPCRPWQTMRHPILLSKDIGHSFNASKTDYEPCQPPTI